MCCILGVWRAGRRALSRGMWRQLSVRPWLPANVQSASATAKLTSVRPWPISGSARPMN
jgi:hypothetical protein